MHRDNYSDLPLRDLVFGAIGNAARVDLLAGFYSGASRRIPEMLVGLDVSHPPQRAGAAGMLSSEPA